MLCISMFGYLYKIWRSTLCSDQVLNDAGPQWSTLSRWDETQSIPAYRSYSHWLSSRCCDMTVWNYKQCLDLFYFPISLKVCESWSAGGFVTWLHGRVHMYFVYKHVLLIWPCTSACLSCMFKMMRWHSPRTLRLSPSVSTPLPPCWDERSYQTCCG